MNLEKELIGQKVTTNLELIKFWRDNYAKAHNRLVQFAIIGLIEFLILVGLCAWIYFK